MQGVIFEKEDCSFSGSKIDCSCSFSRINAEIERNFNLHQQKEPVAHSADASGLTTDLSDAIGEILMMPIPSGGVDVDEIRFQ